MYIYAVTYCAFLKNLKIARLSSDALSELSSNLQPSCQDI